MRARGALLLAVLFLSLLAAGEAQAQGLNEVVGGLLSQGCRRLGGTLVFGIPFSVVTGPFGPELALLCQGLGTARTSGATFGEENRIGIQEAADIERRLRQRQDSGTGFSIFAGTGYRAFSQDTTGFASGFDGDAEHAVVAGDYQFGSAALVGVAGSYRHRSGHYDSGGHFDQDAYGVFLYGSTTPAPRLSIDGVVGYSWQHYTYDRDVTFTGTGFLSSWESTAPRSGQCAVTRMAESWRDASAPVTS